MAGHGAQKLFGVFDGPGLKGTAGFMETLGLAPGYIWGTAAAVSEFGGGTLTVLGLLNPLGPVGTISAMTMASTKAHWGKPIWVISGGAELPVVYIAAAVSLAFSGPGAYSLDNALGIKLPGWMVAATMLGAGAAFGYRIMQPPAQQQPAGEKSPSASEGGDSAARSA